MEALKAMFLKNWKSTVGAFVLPVLYGLHYVGVDVPGLTLPPINEMWPVIMSIFGLGVVGKDGDKTGV